MSSAPIRPAAGVILLRRTSRDPEVFLLHRSGTAAFLPGFHCFPGGAADPGDREVPVLDPPGEPHLAACAARELFEETGVLLVDGPAPPARDREEVRAALLAGRPGFADLLARHDLRVDGRRLRPAGVRVTPPYSPIRFRARFFLAEVGEDAEPEAAPGEFRGGSWWSVKGALGAWAAGELVLVPPTLDALLRLSRAPLEDALESLEASPEGDGLEGPALPLAPGLFYVPQRSRTLPPATHTLCGLVGGDRFLVVDPGSDDPEELAHLDRALRTLEAEGRRPLEGLLTHHHGDHVAGAPWLRRRGIPLAAHPETAARLPFPVDRTVLDGEEWDLGRDPDGLPWRLRALHTPGHAPGHLALFEENRRFLLAGDMVAGVGTIVIDPPEGDLRLYLDSLERLRRLAPRLVVPAHGAAFGPGSDVLERYVRHRLWREERVKAALAGGERDLAELVPEVYDDVPAALHPVAERSLLAHLLKLEAEGFAQRRRDRWARSLCE